MSSTCRHRDDAAIGRAIRDHPDHDVLPAPEAPKQASDRLPADERRLNREFPKLFATSSAA